jgi:hypothetical protein
MFGSPDASRAVADQAQQYSGISSAILKKLLPIIAGILISGLARSGSGEAAPSAPQTSPEPGGGLGDILRQIFRQEAPGSKGSAPSSVPSTSSKEDGNIGTKIGPGSGYQIPTPGNQPSPVPTDAGGQEAPGGDILAQIMRELAKAIEEGRLKPVVVGPIEIGIPGQAGPGSSGQTPTPGGDILGQILRDLLGGKGGQTQPAALMDGIGSAVFGDRLEVGPDVKQSQLESFHQVFDQFLGGQLR